MILKHNCRHTVDDPFYRSTDNWKTAKQWGKLGFKFDEHRADKYDFMGLTYMIRGYRNSACRDFCTRYHKRVMRKK